MEKRWTSPEKKARKLARSTRHFATKPENIATKRRIFAPDCGAAGEHQSE
jgi:hypothetical protein